MLRCYGEHLIGPGALRSTARVVGVAINTVAKPLAGCGADERVRGVAARRLELDEMWPFVHARPRALRRAKSPPPGVGDAWTWTALDPDTRLIVSWMVGGRGLPDAEAFTEDLRSSVVGSLQITTDGLLAYADAVRSAFGRAADFVQIIKVFDRRGMQHTRRVVSRRPDVGACTSLVERQNLTMRMEMLRFTKLTNAHSKRLERILHLAAYLAWYNFCRVHESIGTTPAVAASTAEAPMGVNELTARGLPAPAQG